MVIQQVAYRQRRISGALAISTVFLRDARWRSLLRGLGQLPTVDLLKLWQYTAQGGGLALDSFNFDPDRQLWCPLAVAVGVPEFVRDHDVSVRSNRQGRFLMLALGSDRIGHFSDNPLHGVAGSAFTKARRRDLVAAVCGLILYRENDSYPSSPKPSDFTEVLYQAQKSKVKSVRET